MKTHQHAIQYNYYSEVSLLPVNARKLVNEAKKAAKKTYSPYSKFPVGCCIQLENGQKINSSNQENAAYPSGLCAERVGIFYAHANFPESEIKVITIYAPKAKIKEQPISPCGSCRQVISEYEQKQKSSILIYLVNGNNEIWEFKSIEDLLPFPFLLDQLK